MTPTPASIILTGGCLCGAVRCAVKRGRPGERLDEQMRLTERWRSAYGNAVVPGLAATREH